MNIDTMTTTPSMNRALWFAKHSDAQGVVELLGRLLNGPDFIHTDIRVERAPDALEDFWVVALETEGADVEYVEDPERFNGRK